MKVSKSASDLWRHLRANPTPRMAADRDLGDLVVTIHDASFGTYDWPRVTAELKRPGSRDCRGYWVVASVAGVV
jgi:hypothetical protein